MLNQMRDELFGRRSSNLIHVQEQIDFQGKLAKREDREKVFEKVEIVNLIKALIVLEKL